MDNQEEAETPAAFLKDVGVRLADQKDVDGDLAAILCIHILAGEVADDAVTQAKAAILALAVERAQTSLEVAGD